MGPGNLLLSQAYDDCYTPDSYSCSEGVPVKFGNVYSPAKVGDMENPAAGNQRSMLIRSWVHFFREFGSSGLSINMNYSLESEFVMV